VHSLYLDSPDLRTYQDVQKGEKNRFKLRIRYYDNSDSAAYFEVKRRINDTIQKHRAKVIRGCMRDLLNGTPAAIKHLVEPDAQQFAALTEFCGLMQRLSATPRSHVGYTREAWMSSNTNSLRITFDRTVQCEPQLDCTLHTGFLSGVQPWRDKVICELKFVNSLPPWCIEMVQAFGLVRGGAPKYAQGVLLLGEHSLSNIGVEIELPATRNAPGALPAPAETHAGHSAPA
jgi:hypothetical protein